jgi:hypothetical protein
MGPVLCLGSLGPTRLRQWTHRLHPCCVRCILGGRSGVSANRRMPYEIKMTDAEAIPTAVVRNRVPESELSKFVPAACGEVWSFIRSAGLPPRPPRGPLSGGRVG